jgi:hypothetical protein
VVIVAVLTGIAFSTAGSSGSSAFTAVTTSAPSAEQGAAVPGQSPNSDAEMAAWATENGYLVTDLIDIQDDLEYAVTEPVDVDGAYWAASDLSDWADEAQVADPMPDAAVDAHWQNAVDAYEAAADALMYGIDHVDAGAIADSADFMELGNDELAMATADLERR